MPAEQIMRPGHPPRKPQRDWSLLVPLLCVLAALGVALVAVWLLL